MRRAATLVLPLLALAGAPACGARTIGLYDSTDGGAADVEADAARDGASDSRFETGVDAAFDSALDSASDTSFDEGIDTAIDTAVDTGIDAIGDGPEDPYTVGQLCTGDGDCVGGGANPPQCSSSVVPGFPTDVCVEYGCDPGDGSAVAPCGKETGWCLSTGVGQPGLCLPRCSFDASGNFTAKCAGKDACSYYLYQYDATGRPQGLGYCYAGCTRDADCSGGERCQPETGLCAPSLVTYPLAIGATCTDADSQAGNCICLSTGSSAKGYCSEPCRMGTTSGGGACPSGFTCDGFVPKTAGGAPIFSKVPTGLQGYCLKNCAADADCAAYGGWCYETAGTGAKTCQFYPPT